MSVILLVADGTGFAHYSAMMQHPTARKVFKRFPHTLLVNTAPPYKKPANKNLRLDRLTPVTESASSATAMSTGKWVPHGHIATDAKGRALTTIAEKVKRNKKKRNLGAITTTDHYDATIAAFFSHAKDRDETEAISGQIFKFGLKVLVDNAKLGDMVGKGGRKVDSLANMLPDCLATLSSDAPFFLVLEEALIDKTSHAKHPKQMALELTSLWKTVETCLKWCENPKNETTLLLVSDHATGAATIDNVKNHSRFKFHSGHHDGHLVPLFVAGHACAKAMACVDHSALIDMVDINKILRCLLL